MKKFFSRYGQTLLLAGILILAAYLRLWRISDYMTFLGDEGRDALVVKRMIVDGKFTLLGPTASVGGFFLGPVYYYFMAPFLWLWRLDPSGPAFMVGLFGTATVWVVYEFGRKLKDSWTGLFAAGLYAVSPVVIAYSRSSWNPNLVPFFGLLFIYLTWQGLRQKKDMMLFWAGVCLGIGMQLHYLFIFLIPAVVLWVLLRARKALTVQRIGLWMLGALIGFSPFLAFELRHGFPNTKAITRFLLTGEETGFTVAVFWKNMHDVLFRVWGRLPYRMPEGHVWDRFDPMTIQAWIWGVRASAVASFVFLATQLRKKKGAALMLLWLLVPLALFGLYRRGIYDYYFGIFFAWPFLMIGLLLSSLRKWRWGAAVGLILWAALMYFNWQGRPFLYEPNRQLANARMIAAAALEKTEGKPFNFALETAQNSDHVFRYFFEIWGRPPVTILPTDQDPERNTVTDQLIVICEDLSRCNPLGHPLWEIAGFGQAEIVGTWDIPFVRIVKLVHYTGEESQ
mgnify:CR=1 FL=1